MKDCCKLIKIVSLATLVCTLLVGIVYFLFKNCNQIKCRRIKNQASKVFNEMGELIGEFNYYSKK